MQRSQIYLTESQLSALALVALARGITNSALIREALDEYLAQYAPPIGRAARAQGFGAWSQNSAAPTLRQLRNEERRF